MRSGWMMAAAAALVCAAPASAARYYEFEVTGLTGVPFFDPGTGLQTRLLTQSIITSRFDSMGSPFSSNNNGTRVVFNLGSTSASIVSVGGLGGTTFNLVFDLASIPVGNTLVRIPATGGVGYTSCNVGACVNTPGSLVGLSARTSDVAPPSLAAVETTAIVGVVGLPEPATWATMILGMGAVGFALRRRSKVGMTVKFA